MVVDKSSLNFSFFFFEDFICLFLERGKWGRKRERNINVWLPPTRPLLGTWPTTLTCALSGNWTGWQSFHLQAGTQATEPHQPGLELFKIKYWEEMSWFGWQIMWLPMCRWSNLIPRIILQFRGSFLHFTDDNFESKEVNKGVHSAHLVNGKQPQPCTSGTMQLETMWCLP